MNKETLLQKNKSVLIKYIPEKAIDIINEWILEFNFKLLIKQDRKNKWGDFKYRSNQSVPVITINRSLNKCAFLITLVHEIAHCKTFREFGHNIDPHGKEWKKNFQLLMSNFLNTDIFPIDVLYVLRKHMQNPLASANADIELYKVLMNYNSNYENKALVEYLNDGDKFEYENKLYQRISQKRKRIECLELSTGKKYLFSPVVEVNIVE